MGRDYHLVEKLERGEIVFDEGEYTFVPKDFTPYSYKKSKSLSRLKDKIKKECGHWK